METFKSFKKIYNIDRIILIFFIQFHIDFIFKIYFQ